MSRFRQRFEQLSHSQLVALSEALSEELYNLRPDEIAQADSADDWVYHYRWQVASALAPVASGVSWLLYGDDGLAPAIERGDCIKTPLRFDGPLEQQAALVRQQLQALLGERQPPDQLLLWLAPEPCADAVAVYDLWRRAMSAAAAVQSLPSNLRLSVVVQQPMVDDLSPAAQALAGLGRSLSLEMPNHWDGIIYLDDIAKRWQAVQAEIGHGSEDEVRLFGGRREVQRLNRHELPSKGQSIPETLPLAHKGSYLITGALGGIGIAIVDRLLAQGAGALALLGRKSESDYLHAGGDAAEAIVRWRRDYPNARVNLYGADVGDENALSLALSEIKQDLPPLKGFIHAAGVNDTIPLSELTEQDFSRICHAKVAGSLNLAKVADTLDLDFELYFSSVAARWGTGSMTAYALASRFVEALASARRASGRPASTIAWGPWGDVGMIVKQDKGAYAALGFELMPAQKALDLMMTVHRVWPSDITVVSIDWAKYRAALENPRHLALFGALTQRSVASRTAKTSTLSFQSVELACQSLAEIIGRLLGSPLTQAQWQAPLQDLGVTSLLGIELAAELSLLSGESFRSTLIFDYPTIEELAAYLFEHGRSVPAAASYNEAAEKAQGDDIAVIAIACQLPQAQTPEQLWQLISAEQPVDAIEDTPQSRFDIERYLGRFDEPGKSYSFSGGYLDDIRLFDHELFGISAAEARWMDPQQRLALETAWRAFERAGVDVAGLKGQNVGVYFGVGQNEYGPLCRAAMTDDTTGLMPTGQSMNIIAGRLGHIFGFTGPAMAIDTACSSALVALDCAVGDLRRGRTALALVGGVNALVSADTFVLLSKSQALSRQGRCAAFDASADGYVRAEGAVACLLKRLDDAIAGNDPIDMVIKGIAVNHDGVSSSLTAPNGRSQQAVMRAALDDAGIAPGQVEVIEAHGTGTPLGDPIEYHAIDSVYCRGVDRDLPLKVGTVKAHIGHAEAASGLAGLAKLALTFKHKVMPGQANYRQLNPHIDATDAIVVPSGPQALGEHIVTAGLSAFGFCGTNVHVIAQSYPERARVRAALPPRPFSRRVCWYTDEPVKDSSSLAQAFGLFTYQSDTIEGMQPLSRSWHEYDAQTTAQLPQCAVVLSALTCQPSQWLDRLQQAVTAEGVQWQGVEEIPSQLSEQDCLLLPLCWPGRLFTQPDAAAMQSLLGEGYRSLHQRLGQLADSHKKGGPGRIVLWVQGSDALFDGSCLSGLIYSLKAEHPALDIRLVAMTSECDVNQLSAALPTLLTPPETFCRYQANGLQLPRLTPTDALCREKVVLGGTFIVTGGLGGIGRKAIEWLVAQGVKAIVNINRSLPTPQQQAQLNELAATNGVTVQLKTLDLTEFSSLSAELDSVLASLPPLEGIFHCAGVLEDSRFEEQSWYSVERLLSAKLIGAWHLHRYTQTTPVKHFILCSSLSAVTGNSYQAGYALANALADELCRYRNGLGLSGLSLDWGPWLDAGMAAEHRAVLEPKYRALGLTMRSAEDYFSVLTALLEKGRGPCVVADMDWRQYRTQSAHPQLLDELLGPVEQGSTSQPPSLAERLAPMSNNHRTRLVAQQIKQALRDTLALSPEQDIDEHQGFSEMGVDSIHSMVLKQKLEQGLGLALPETVTFDYPTVEALSSFALTQLCPETTEAKTEVVASEQALDDMDEAALLAMLEDEMSAADEL